METPILGLLKKHWVWLSKIHRIWNSESKIAQNTTPVQKIARQTSFDASRKTSTVIASNGIVVTGPRFRICSTSQLVFVYTKQCSSRKLKKWANQRVDENVQKFTITLELKWFLESTRFGFEQHRTVEWFCEKKLLFWIHPEDCHDIDVKSVETKKGDQKELYVGVIGR